jgi:N-acyl-D-aspartate/D-glutamate deacylase
MTSELELLIKNAGFENIIICISQRHEKYIGKSVAEIAKIEAKNAYDVFFDLLIEEKMEVGMILIYKFCCTKKGWIPF